ncbi:MAG: hypothetical protein V3U35_03445, partial [Candidatus Neomarinimicrobiota bacterium]
QYPEQCLQVRYEDVVAKPVESLGRMLRWLGEDEVSAAEVVERYLTGGVTLDPSRIGEWEREMSSADRMAFQDIAGATLEDLGYGVSR